MVALDASHIVDTVISFGYASKQKDLEGCHLFSLHLSMKYIELPNRGSNHDHILQIPFNSFRFIQRLISRYPAPSLPLYQRLRSADPRFCREISRALFSIRYHDGGTFSWYSGIFSNPHIGILLHYHAAPLRVPRSIPSILCTSSRQ